MEYRDLLKRAYTQLPNVMKHGERFEIPQFESEKSGSRTVIKNFREVSKALRRPEDQFAKYIIKESGTSGQISGKELIIQGRFSRGILNQKLENYCKKYIICDCCGKPDTNLHKEKGVLILKCEACGSRAVV